MRSPAAHGGIIRSRFDASKISGISVGERDAKMLGDLYLHRAMTRGQLQELYFGSVTRANTRLRQLFDHRYVSRFYPPASPYGSEAVYSIDLAAFPVVADRLGLDVHEVRLQSRRSPRPLFLEHTIAISGFRIALLRGVDRSPGIKLGSWLPEIALRHEYEIRKSGGRAWQSEIFKPDAYFALDREGSLRHFFVEIDCGNVSARKFSLKAATYERYRASGLFERQFGSREFAVAVVTTGKRRIRSLANAAGNDSDFAFTTFEDSSTRGPLAPVWRALPDLSLEGNL